MDLPLRPTSVVLRGVERKTQGLKEARRYNGKFIRIRNVIDSIKTG